MTRRSLIHLLAYAAALPEFGAFRAQAEHNHSQAPPEPDYWSNYQPKFFDADDFAALEAFTEILIPTDETPGAREAHCAHFIDFVLAASGEYAPETQRQWRNALARLRDLGFHSAGNEQRAAIIEAISLPERDPTKTHPAFSTYQLIKRESVFAFYTARAGMIDALDYRGNSYNVTFPACTHPEHHVV
ncbi:MAG TPA: gluconate 2-dehydrogenase subunit 3 family protein [Bryobacteraceae bacterium]|nr:gluconate 2-dehydrogenase subunit 3 family protein [Bryobacteraceae bacterium]